MWNRLGTVAHLLNKADYGVVPVLNQLSRGVLGVITERSICLEVVAQRRNPATVPAGECMAYAPVVCHPEDDSYAGKILTILRPWCGRGK